MVGVSSTEVRRDAFDTVITPYGSLDLRQFGPNSDDLRLSGPLFEDPDPGELPADMRGIYLDARLGVAGPRTIRDVTVSRYRYRRGVNGGSGGTGGTLDGSTALASAADLVDLIATRVHLTYTALVEEPITTVRVTHHPLTECVPFGRVSGVRGITGM